MSPSSSSLPLVKYQKPSKTRNIRINIVKDLINSKIKSIESEVSQ